MLLTYSYKIKLFRVEMLHSCMALNDVHHMIQYKCISGWAAMLNQWWGLKSPPIKGSSRRTLLLSMSTYLPPSYQISRRESLWIRYRIQILFCTLNACSSDPDIVSKYCFLIWSSYYPKQFQPNLGITWNYKKQTEWSSFIPTCFQRKGDYRTTTMNIKKQFWYLKEVVS